MGELLERAKRNAVFCFTEETYVDSMVRSKIIVDGMQIGDVLFAVYRDGDKPLVVKGRIRLYRSPDVFDGKDEFLTSQVYAMPDGKEAAREFATLMVSRVPSSTKPELIVVEGGAMKFAEIIQRSEGFHMRMVEKLDPGKEGRE